MFNELKCINKLNLLIRLLLLIFVVLSCRLPAAIGQSELELGTGCFKNRDYKTALIHFNKALKADPDDCNSLYYEAITLHKLGELELAKKAYAAVIMRFPNTQAAQNSQKALAYLSSSYLSNFKQQILSGNKEIAPGTAKNPLNRTVPTMVDRSMRPQTLPDCQTKCVCLTKRKCAIY